VIAEYVLNVLCVGHCLSNACWIIDQIDFDKKNHRSGWLMVIEIHCGWVLLLPNHLT